jgi:hypothetical protein
VLIGRRKIIILLSAVFLISISCRTAQRITDGSLMQAAPTDTPLPTTAPPTVPTSAPEMNPPETPAQTLMPGLLFIDEFTDTASGWPVQNTESSLIDYYEGGYRIMVNGVDSAAYSVVGPNLGNVRILVDATLLDGGVDNYFGAICRYQDAGNYYMGLITSDGFYAIVKFQAGVPEFLSSDRWEEAIVINQGGALNLIELTCIRSQIGLTVNGQQLSLIEDDGIDSGDVGMVVGTISVESTSILFDNFTLYLEE